MMNDNFGMNPMMGMNPIFGMNNNMNNQINFMNNMDSTTQNVKNIIEPYEMKIKQLEEIIRQKEFEIAVLKRKLYNNSQQNMMNMNQMNNIMINQMNPMMMNMMNNNLMENNIREKEISLRIKLDNDKIEIFKCFITDKVCILREKFNIDKGEHFTYNYQPIDQTITFKENRIYDFSLIELKKNKILNLLFRSSMGDSLNIALSEDCPLGIAISYFFIKNDNPRLLNSILSGKIQYIFLFNANKLDIQNETPIGEYFENMSNPTIRVNF